MDTLDNTKKEKELERKLTEIRSKGTEDQYSSLAKRLNLPFSDLKSAPIDLSALELIPEELARSANIAAILRTGNNLTIAALDPEDKKAKEVIKDFEDKGYKIGIIITIPKSLGLLWERYKNLAAPETFKIGSIEVNEKEVNALQEKIKNISDLKNQITKISTTRLLEMIIAGALKTEASDAHFEPESNNVRIRYRLDGILNEIAQIDFKSHEKIVNRIKVLSKLKLNIQKSPQDGRFTIKQGETRIEVRVSVLPGEMGETIVMRLLDPRKIKQGLEELGFLKEVLGQVEKQLSEPNGAILNTGPTGSGKTTTLYAFVTHLNTPTKKIITIEDPIEYRIEGVSQTQVEPKRGYDFPNGLRAIVRQDPDIILIGEIRDADTADTALHASLTGHLVFSTLHTNDAAGAIPRLIDFDINPQIIAPALRMVIAQRLVRKLCPECKKEDFIPKNRLEEIKESLKLASSKIKLPKKIEEDTKIFFPGKCEACNNTGYKGRIGVFEIFRVDQEMEKIILSSPSVSEIRDEAVAKGMITMIQDAYIKLLEGITSIEEIDRVL